MQPWTREAGDGKSRDRTQITLGGRWILRCEEQGFWHTKMVQSLKLNMSSLKIGHPKGKASYSNHRCSGVMLGSIYSGMVQLLQPAVRNSGSTRSGQTHFLFFSIKQAMTSHLQHILAWDLLVPWKDKPHTSSPNDGFSWWFTILESQTSPERNKRSPIQLTLKICTSMSTTKTSTQALLHQWIARNSAIGWIFWLASYIHLHLFLCLAKIKPEAGG